MRLFSFAPPEKQEGAAVLKNGQSVSLYVRSVNPDGTARIQVAGADVTARSELPPKAPLQAGLVLKGTVLFENGRVYIRVGPPPPQRAFSFSSFLASSGISPSEAAFHALAFFHVSGMRMEASAIQRILYLAAAFPLKELRACEAASLLFRKGLPLTGSNLKSAVDMLEGKLPAGSFAEDALRVDGIVLPFNPRADTGRGKNSDGGQEMEGKKERGGKSVYESGEGGEGAESKAEAAANDKDSADLDFFCKFIGKDKEKGAEDGGAELDWHILPFKRNFGETEFTGSIRFLMDKSKGKAIETRITAASEYGFSADFILSESGCRFAVIPPPSGQAISRLSAELAKMLKNAGIPSPVEYGFDANAFQARSVNIEI